mmetsp:Transcript_5577/g.18908  ORF Transcript_5577/g.18908 Transcript_5577/m.18908 type:complete len:287 (+) Transcript_5577:918-1778(+)
MEARVRARELRTIDQAALHTTTGRLLGQSSATAFSVGCRAAAAARGAPQPTRTAHESETRLDGQGTRRVGTRGRAPAMGKRRRRAPEEAPPGWQVRGPPMRTVSGRMSMRTVENDEWQTTKRTWAQLAPVLGQWQASMVWMPFYYDGECQRHLRECGFSAVIHRDEDFFTLVRDASFMAGVDIIVDNPPYQGQETKEKILRALADCGKPFVMLLPMSILHVAFVRAILDMSQVQVVIPRRVYVRKKGQAEVPFKYLVWLAYKVGLPRDLVFLEEDGEVEEDGEEEG